MRKEFRLHRYCACQELMPKDYAESVVTNHTEWSKDDRLYGTLLACRLGKQLPFQGSMLGMKFQCP
jgi:hypothetical protein